jgi:hypothetical protein
LVALLKDHISSRAGVDQHSPALRLYVDL